jgi:hypothetical protein
MRVLVVIHLLRIMCVCVSVSVCLCLQVCDSDP